MRTLGLVCCVLILTQSVWAQEMKKEAFSISVQPAYAMVWAHSKDISFIKGTRGTGFQVSLNRLRLDETA